MNSTQSLQKMSLISLCAAAVTLVMQACGGGAVAASTTDPDPMVGVWDSTVTVKDCMSGVVLATFRGLGAVHQGGTWTSVNSNPPTSAGPTLGTWKNEGNGSYTTALVFLRFNPDLTPAGYQKAKSTRTLAADGNSYASVITRQTLDMAGNVLSQGCASETATRVSW